jgi:hypothetical protein
MTIESPTLVEDDALTLPEEVQYLRWTPIVAGDSVRRRSPSF